ncbi:MAG: cytidine deaminase [Clostridia bacterium]|nr:cytidine deaminase [Clostridia bacterium]
MTDLELMQAAEAARENAYAPYSRFHVGAALLAKDGRVFLGCNVENVSFGATNCAERTAVFSAVAAGVREFSAIAITGGAQDKPADFCPPCGICRQVLAEFGGKELRVLLGNSKKYESYTVADLLPLAFEEKSLGENAK